MGNGCLSITYCSSVQDLCSINSSFDYGVLKVAYHGENRNGSSISKDVFEKCIKTIYNCPVVCNYDRESDGIGSHDVDIVVKDGKVKIINITQPVGVVPESAEYWWETIEDASGVHEYLCVDVLIWKRQEAYEKIKGNCITDESMEIKVTSGHTEDGVYIIDSFEFLAFCLLEAAEPCYESAGLEMFSKSNFMKQLGDMMEEFRNVKTVNASIDVDKYSKANLAEGGKLSLKRKIELIKKYGIDVEKFGIDVVSMSYEELEKALIKFSDDDGADAGADGGSESPSDDGAGSDHSGETGSGEGTGEDTGEGTGEGTDEGTGAGSSTSDNGESGATGSGTGTESTESDDDNKKKKSYSLTGEQLRESLIDAVYAVKVQTEWGETCRYWYVDYDQTTNEVYCYDGEDWCLYGFTYSINGDNVSVDFECKKKKKFSIVDFDEGDAEFSCKETFNKIISESTFAGEQRAANKYSSENAELTKKCEQLNSEVEELRRYQKETSEKERSSRLDAIFNAFAELNGNEQFEELRKNNSKMSLSDIEEKCYSIIGRKHAFSIKQKSTTRLPIEHRAKDVDDLYGGIFNEFPPTR